MAWLIVGLYVATIFVTLPFAPLLWSALSTYSHISYRFAASFVLLLPLTGCTLFILWQSSRRRLEIEKREIEGDLCPNSLSQFSPFWRVAGLVLMATLSLLMLIFLAETPAETLHLLEYGGLSYLTFRAAKPHTYHSYLFCLLFIFFVGSVDEAIQFVLPNRFFDARDVVLNGLCGIIGLATTTTLLHPPTQSPPC